MDTARRAIAAAVALRQAGKQQFEEALATGAGPRQALVGRYGIAFGANVIMAPGLQMSIDMAAKAALLNEAPIGSATCIRVLRWHPGAAARDALLAVRNASHCTASQEDAGWEALAVAAATLRAARHEPA